ncbi:MAG: hypothetical protein RL490_476 [Pseudomonadota bacterium]|jgi:outer membrane lipoprotein SlyB
MMRILAVVAIIGLGGCVSTDQYSANQTCASTAGCVSSFANTHQGPIQAQAVAPQAPSGLQPQR